MRTNELCGAEGNWHCSNRLWLGCPIGSRLTMRACGRAQFTNVGKDFKGTLDYILYTTDSLAPVAMLELPDESEVPPTSVF